MKKIFTLLALLVVTVNAAAQNQAYLNVGDPDSFGVFFKINPTDNDRQIGLKCFYENGRLNVCGYPFYKQKEGWGWIDRNSTIGNGSTFVTGWNETDIFKGAANLFGISAKYSAGNTNATGDNQILRFYITNCSGIDVFLYHVPSTSIFSDYSGTFSINANPLENGESLSTTVVINDKDEVHSYFPTLYGLDKNKHYEIVLSIPKKTYLYEFSFLSRDLRTYTTKVTDGVNWGTMYLDFPVTIPTDHPKLQVFAVSSADETNGCSVFPITGSIPKNTGVLLYEPDVPTHKTITFTETGEPDPVISMLAGTAETDFTVAKALQGKSQTTKVLTLGREKNNPDLVGFFIYNGTTLSQYKAYLTYDYGTPTSGSNVKGFYISGFDELTGVQTLEIENTEPGNWYSLQGVRLNARPTQRGIYLNNGKKVLVK